jgi:hypothetical protein
MCNSLLCVNDMNEQNHVALLDRWTLFLTQVVVLRLILILLIHVYITLYLTSCFTR